MVYSHRMETRNSVHVADKRRRSSQKNVSCSEKTRKVYMKETLAKLKAILHDLEKKHGPILVLALFSRLDSPERWDLVVAAPWLDSAGANSYKLITTKIQNLLSSEEIIQLSRVVILDADDPVVSFLQDNYNVPNGSMKAIDNCEPFTQRFNFTVRRAYLLRCIR